MNVTVLTSNQPRHVAGSAARDDRRRRVRGADTIRSSRTRSDFSKVPDDAGFLHHTAGEPVSARTTSWQRAIVTGEDG
jgi:hypothetical protein